MSKFDFDKYIASKLETESDYSYLDQPSFASKQLDKFQQVADAAAAKKAALTDTTVGRLGLDPEGLAGGAVNMGMRAVNTVSRMLGEVRTAPTNAIDSLRERLVGNEILQAAARKDQGKATQEDLDLLAQDANVNFSDDPQNLTEAAQMFQQAPLGVPMMVDAAISNLRGMTNQDRVDAIKDSRKETAEIRDAFNATDMYVYKGVTDKFDKDLMAKDTPQDLKAITDTYAAVSKGEDGSTKKVFTEAIPALASLLMNVGETAVDNPQAAGEYIVENLPQLAVGLLGRGALTTTNAAYALDYHNKGVLAYQEANNGALPTGEEAQKIALKAASLALAEQVGETGVLKSIGLGKTAAVEGAESLGKQVAGRAGKVTSSTLAEGATEGFQTAVESSLEGKEITAEDVYKGAAIGTIASAGVTIPAQAAGVLKDGLEEIARKSKAGLTPALASVGEKERPTPEQELGQAKVLEALAKTRFQNAGPEDQAKIAEQIATQTAAMEATKNPKQKKTIEQTLGLLNSLVVSPNEVKHLEKRLTAASEKVAKAEVAFNDWTNQRNKVGDIKEQVTAATQAVQQDDQVQADQVKQAKTGLVETALKNPALISAETADELASSPNFSPEEQQYFRYLAKTKRTDRTAISVDEAYDDAVTGLPDTKNLSLADHEARINAAISNGDARATTAAVSVLDRFAKGKTDKAAVLEQALATFRETGAPQYAYPVNGKWQFSATPMNREALNTVNGLEVTSALRGTVAKVRQEATVLNEAVEATNQRLALLQKPVTVPAPVKASVPNVEKLSDVELNDLLETIERNDPRFDALNKEMNKRETEAGEEEAAKQEEEAQAKDKVKAKPQPQSESVVTTGQEQTRKELVTRFADAPTERIVKAIDARLKKAAAVEAQDQTKAAFLRGDAKALRDMLISRGEKETKKEAPKKKTVEKKVDKKAEKAPAKVTPPLTLVGLQAKIRILGQLQLIKFGGAKATPELSGYVIEDIAAEVQRNLRENDYGLPQEIVDLQVMLASADGLVTKAQLWAWAKTLKDSPPHLKKLLQALFRSELTNHFKGFSSYTSLTMFEGKEYIAAGTARSDGFIGYNFFSPDRVNSPLVILVHEVLHLATRNGIESDLVLKGDINELQQQIKEWLKDNEKTLTPADAQQLRYALKNPHELLTVALTDTNVARILDKIVLPSKATALQKFATALLNFFRRSGEFKADEMSALAKTLEFADAIFEGKAEIQEKAPAVDPFEADIAAVEASFLQSFKEALVEEAEPAVAERRTNEVSPLMGSEEGTLDVFSTALVGEVNADNYKEVNLLAQMFKQTGSRGNATTPRSLVAVKDFLSAVMEGAVSLKDVVNHKPTARQTALFEYFLKMREGWDDVLTRMVAIDTNKEGVQWTDFRHLNALQFFLNEEGKLEENVKTAILVVAAQYLKDKASAGNFRTSEEINSFLGREKKTYVSPQLRKLLGGLIGSEANAHAMLGKQVFDILGIVPKDGKTFTNEQSRMESAVGAVIPVLLEQLGLLKTEHVLLHDINNAIDFDKEGGSPKNTPENSKKSLAFLRLNQDAVSLEVLGDLKEAFKGTGNFLGDVFGAENSLVLPTQEPQKLKVTSLARGKQVVSKLVQKVTKTLNNQAYIVRSDVLALLNTDRKFFESLAGITDVGDSTAHVDERDSLVSKVENQRVEIDKALDALAYMDDTFEGKKESEFYVETDPWKNNRLGYLSTFVNMQTSKIHRFLFKKASWVTTVPTKEGDPMLDSFKLRVMEGLGAKTDNGTDSTHLKKWKDYAENPVFIAAAEALRKTQTIEEDGSVALTDGDKAAILAGVTKGKGKLHSLEALMALSRYLQAVEQGLDSFDTTVTAEIDGKTNGVMLSNWLLGTLGKRFAERGGFYTLKSEFKHFSQWKPGENDVYEHLMTVSNQFISWVATEGGEGYPELMDSVFALTGKLFDDGKVTSAGRNILKDPLIALNYGSGIKRAKEAIGEAFVSRVYETIADIHNGKEYDGRTGKAALDTLEYDLNTMVRARSVRAFAQEPKFKLQPMGRQFSFGSTTEAMNTPFTKQQLSMLMQAHKALVGDAIGIAMQSELGDYIETRKQLVAASNLSFKIYNSTYQAIRKAYVENLIAKKGIAVDAAKVALHELTKEQENEVLALVERMAPRMHSASSLGGDINTGFYMGGSSNTLVKERPYQGRLTYIGPKGNKITLGTQGYARVNKEPGVTFMSSGVQGTDGDIMMRTLMGFDAIGVHDAIMVALKDAEAAGLKLNQQTFESLLNYSLPMAGYNMLERTLKGLEYSLARWGNPKQLKGLAAEILVHVAEYQASAQGGKAEEWVGNILPSQVLEGLFQAAVKADTTKLTGLSKLGIIDQYTMQKAAWEVTDDARDAAQKALENLPEAIDAAVVKKMENLDKLLTQSQTASVEEGGRNLAEVLSERIDQKIEAIKYGTTGVTNAVSEVTDIESQAEDYVEPANSEEEAEDEHNAPPAYVLPAGVPTSSFGVYEALGNGTNPVTNIADNTRLRELLTNFIPKLYGPFEAMYAAAQDKLYNDPAGVFLANVADGNTPFYTDVENSPFAMGEQMGYVAELVQQIIGSSMTDLTTVAQKELEKLFNEARKAIDPLSFDTDPATSQEMYDFLFKIPKGDLAAQYLSRFAAMGMVHPLVAQALGFETHKAEDETPKTLYGKIFKWFREAIDYLSAGLNKAYGGQVANAKLRVIVDRIVELEANRISRKQETKWDELQEQIGEHAEGMNDKVRGKIANLARTDFFTKSSSPFIRFSGDLVAKAAEHRLEEITTGFAHFYHKSVSGRAGEMAELANELRGTTDDKKWGHLATLIAKLHEKIRKEISTSTSKAVLESFEDKGANITNEDKSALTNVLLRSGVFSLLEGDTFTTADIADMLSNPARIQQAINGIAAGVSGPYRDYYLNQVNHTGWYLATGNDSSGNLMKNAVSLAYLDGTVNLGQVSQADAEAVAPMLDKLMSLYALKYANNAQKTRVASIMRTELARTDGDGIEVTLGLAKHNYEKALKDNFNGNPRLMEKGFVPTIVDPRVETKVVTARDVAGLEAQGWKKGPVVGVDPAVSTDTHYMMIMRRGLRHRLTGTLGLNNLKAKGQANLITDPNEVNKIETAKQAVINRLFRPQPNLNPAAVSTSHTSPLFNESGIVVGYRYTANHKTLKDVFKHNNQFDELIGAAASTIYSKVNTSHQNKVIVDGLHTQWSAQKDKRDFEYIAVSPKSKDPEVVQAWALLPAETRDYIEKVWGGKGLMVRRDMYNMHFGYRKFGLAEMIEKNPQDRKLFEQAFTWIVKDVFRLGDKAAMRVSQAQDIWEALVKEVKDIIVVRTGATLFWNIISNLTLLYVRGVPLLDIVRSHRIAFKGALRWEEDIAELRQLKAVQKSGYKGNVAELEHRIAELESALHRNPVRNLIEAGLMPSIVEDVEEDVNAFTYKNDLVEFTDKYTQKLPKVVRDAGKILYVSHDTALYKVLSQGTQLSDFVARYTLYQYETGRKKDPMSHEQAVLSASDAFVNYDIPSGKGLQFLNDMGLVMFTKYYLRIQRTIQQAIIDRPLRALTLGLADNYFLGIQTVLDSSLIANPGINLGWGAFEYPDAVFEGLPMRMLGDLFH